MTFWPVAPSKLSLKRGASTAIARHARALVDCHHRVRTGRGPAMVPQPHAPMIARQLRAPVPVVGHGFGPRHAARLARDADRRRRMAGRVLGIEGEARSKRQRQKA